MEERRIWFLILISALFLISAVPCVEAEDQSMPIQADPAPPPSDIRRPLIIPNNTGETQRVPIQTDPAPTPPSSRNRRPLIAPNSNAETQRVQTEGTPQSTQTPGEQPGFTERHGAAVLTVLLTTEQIIRCKNEGLSSGDCACRLLEQAAVGTGISVGAMLTGTAPVLVAVGAATMTVKGFQNSVEIMYEGGSLVQALIEEERIERERERQQEINRPRLAEMLDLEKIKTLGLLQGQAQTLEGLCRNLEDMATEAEKYGNLAQEEMATLAVGPEITAEIEETAKLCVNATAHIESIRARVTGYASQIRETLERLNSQCRSCTTSEEAEKIREGYDACTGLMRGIRQLHDEALQKGEEIRRIQSNAVRFHSIVDMATKSKEHIFTFEGHAVKHSRAFGETLQGVIDGNNSLVSACAESDRNIENLRKAFGELSPEETARFTELKELVDSFRGKVCDYDPLKNRYDNARYRAVDTKLSSENLIRSLEFSIAGLDECDSASVDTLFTDIAAAEQDAALAIAAHADLPTMANECATPRSATGTGAGSGETDGGDADDDFSDEGTIIGSGGGQDGLEPDQATDESRTAQEPIPDLADEGSSVRPGRPSAPEAGDDFADLGSNVGSSPSGEETVTYFDRDWLPRSWKTSGNAAETRAEIYQTASRMGWAAALAEYTGPSSDPLISDHVLAASGHMERANAASFAPHKAWPDWSNRRNNYNRWIQRLTSGTQISREYFRKGLAATLKSEAGALKRQLETIATGQAGTLQNCDTYIFEIGYQLAFASQLQSIAIDGLEAGQKKDWARKLWNRASSSIASAGSAIQKTKPGSGRVGCSDFTPLSKELSRVQSRLSSVLEPEVHSVWNQGLAVAAGGSDQLHDSDDLAGEWVISTAPFSWGSYINRNAGAPVDPHAASTVRVRIEPRGKEYVGVISRQGQVPVMSDAYTYEQTGRNRIQLFHDGLEYLRLKKTGRNLFEGDILQVTLNNRLEPRPVYIVVYDEAAKLLERFQNRDREQLTRGSKWGVLMLRLDAAGPSGGPNMEAVGRHVFVGMENEIPRGARIVFRGPDLGKIGDSWAPFYGFKHQKPFRFESVTDNNPGLGINLYYLGDAGSRALDDGNCGFSPEYYRPLQSSRFERHGGKGVYSLATLLSPVRKPIDYTLLSRLIWSRDEWVISIYGHDYPNHSGTQFGGQQGQLNHMIRLLDRLVPRLKTIPPGAMAPGDGSPSFRQSGSSASPSPEGMNLLGIEAQ